MSHAFTPTECYRGFESLRDGYAVEYQKRTGKSYFSELGKGRPRRMRLTRRKPAGPASAASPSSLGGAEMP